MTVAATGDTGLFIPHGSNGTRFMAEITREQDVTVVDLDQAYDALDTQGIQRIESLLITKVATAEPPRVVIDMSHTEYIGSRFIEVLFRTWKQIRERQGQMALCGLSPFCKDVLTAARLDKIWPIHATRAEAVAEVGGNSGV